MSKKLKKIHYEEKPRKSWSPDLSGQKFHDFLVIRFLGISKKGNVWECLCVCGKLIQLTTGYLREGKLKNCGCKYINPATTHRLHGTRMYRIWAAMKTRCYNKNVPHYINYGCRGITVCDRWVNSFENFYEDMKEGYADNLKLDRIDNNGNYCKENCRWSTDGEQSRNKRNNYWYERNGLRMIKMDWADYLGTSHQYINHRLRAGWTFDQIYDYYIKFKNESR